jgi:hypothetical protein
VLRWLELLCKGIDLGMPGCTKGFEASHSIEVVASCFLCEEMILRHGCQQSVVVGPISKRVSAWSYSISSTRHGSGRSVDHRSRKLTIPGNGRRVVSNFGFSEYHESCPQTNNRLRFFLYQSTRRRHGISPLSRSSYEWSRISHYRALKKVID